MMSRNKPVDWTSLSLVLISSLACGATETNLPSEEEAPSGGSAGLAPPSQEVAGQVPETDVESVDAGPAQAEPASGGSPAESSPTGPAAVVAEECPSYDSGFRVVVHEPVCSECHFSGATVPDWGSVDTALASCREIGTRVLSGSMPPNGSLSAAQLDLVSAWVALGCPGSDFEARARCRGEGDSPAEPTAMDGPTVVVVDRARLRDGELEVRGEVSRGDVGITIEFAGRSERVINDRGDFRAEFRNVPDDTSEVTITTSDGARVTVPVER